MSNKHQAVILIVRQEELTGLSSPSLDQLIKEGNSSLLVLRQGKQDDISLFNAVTSISQLDSE